MINKHIDGLDSDRLKFIDSIRGIAILMVILVHTGHSLNYSRMGGDGIIAYGQMGVQLFFVVSAFTLCLTYDKRKKEEHSLLVYIVKRFFRIAPPYYLGIIGYFVVDTIVSFETTGTFSHALVQRYTSTNILANFFLVHGFVPSAYNNIVPGGWSIGTEVAFYVIFPVLFIIIDKFIKSRICKAVLCLAIFLLISILTDCIIYFIAGVRVKNNNFLYCNLFNQLPVFVVGICYYFIWKTNRLSFSASINFAFFIIISIIALTLWQIGNTSFLYVIIPFLAGLSFIFLIEVFRKISCINSRFLMKIGRVSYSAYLIHFIFVHWTANRIATGIVKVFGRELTFITSYFIIVSFTILFAVVSERLIERFSINLGNWICARFLMRKSQK